MDNPSRHNEDDDIPQPPLEDLTDLFETITGHAAPETTAQTLARCLKQKAKLETDLAEVSPDSPLLPGIRQELRELELRIRECQHILNSNN